MTDREKGIDRLCGLLEEIISQNDIIIEKLEAVEEKLEWLNEDDDLDLPDPMDVIRELAKEILDRQQPFAADGEPIMRAIRESSR